MVEDSRGPPHNILEALDNDYLNSVLNYASILPRLVWSLLGAVMLGLALYVTILLVADYRSFPSYTKVSSESSHQFNFPAITVCNINILNQSAMEADRVEGTEYFVYDLYQELISSFQIRGQETESNVPYELLDDLDLYRNYKWDILSTLDLTSVEFAKEIVEPGTMAELIQVDYTEMGNCLEINDNEILVQKVNGPVGGLSFVLDTKVSHYTSDTTSQGFFIMLRMPGEKVVNKEYAFRVTPGHEVFVRLNPIQVSRLGEPWGTCLDAPDIFTEYSLDEDDEMDVMSVKECFSSQVLWSYMKDEVCRCFPWYIYERYINNNGQKNDELYNALIEYWSNGLPEDKRIQFGTTEVVSDQYSWAGTVIESSTQPSVQDCARQCESNDECSKFMFTDARFLPSLESGGSCELFEASATLSDSLGYKVFRGTVDGTGEVHECSISKENICGNLVMETLMSGDLSDLPPSCSEPCSYNRTEYSLSMSRFPAQRLWEATLSDKYPQYSTLDAAQRNLIKLVFFQDVMRMTTETQTASYEIQNFIAELGGTVDLFIGISFYTIYKLIEWVMYYIYRRHSKHKGASGPQSQAANKI